MPEPRRIDAIYVFVTGRVSVCDQFGLPMLEYQGAWRQMQAKIEADKPPGVQVHYQPGQLYQRPYR